MAKEEPLQSLLPLSRVPPASEHDPVSSGLLPRGTAEAAQVHGLLSGIIEVSPTAIVVVDEDCRVVVVNKLACAILGTRLPCLVGYSLARYLNKEHLDAARLLLLSGAPSYKYRDRISSEEAERDLEVHVSLLSDPSGELLCINLLDRTDADRERAEWESLSMGHPPSVHLQRAHHLEALGHLTGMFAHDFNNLLAVILGSLEAAERRMKRDEQPLEDISRALGATERSIQATSEILHYVRRRGTEPEALSPGEVIVELRGLIERAVGEEIELIVDTRRTARIRLAATHLETAVLNLVINARDATSPGGTIEIVLSPVKMGKERSLELKIPPGEYVSLSVRDSGCGMSEEVRIRASEPFFTTKPEGLGTGLGLSSVCGIMRGLGGALVIQSELGKGTTVELLFPAEQTDADHSRGPAAVPGVDEC